MSRQRSDDRGRAGGAVSPVRFRRAEKSLRRDFARRRPRFAEPESSFAEGSDTAARIGRRHPNPLFVPSFGTFFYEGENETYIEASAENSGSILYDKEIRDKPRTRRTKRNV